MQSDIHANNQKNKVLCLIESLGRGGGAEHLLVSLIPELKKLGVSIDVAVLYSLPDDLGDELEFEGIKVHRLDVSSKWAFVKIVRSILKLHKNNHYHIFWGHLYFSNLYVQLAALFSPGVKTAITLHSEGYAKQKSMSFKEKVLVHLERLVIRGADAKVAVSSAVSSDYTSFFGWKNIKVIYNGIVTQRLPKELDANRRSQIRESLELDDSDYLLVTPARFVQKKGHVYLLEALSELKQEKSWCPKLIACGQGPLFDDLRVQAKKLGVENETRFVTPIPHCELMDLILCADAVVLPSLREPFGIAAAEGMALGKPTLLSEVDGFLELVGDSQSALMFPAGDSEGLKNAIWELYSDEQLQSDLGQHGQKRIQENFDISVCATEWSRLFDALLEVKA